MPLKCPKNLISAIGGVPCFLMTLRGMMGPELNVLGSVMPILSGIYAMAV